MPTDLITCIDSYKYEIKEFKDFGDKVLVVLYDKDTCMYQAFFCDYEDDWIFPKFYPDQVVQSSERLSYESYKHTFNEIVSKKHYGF